MTLNQVRVLGKCIEGASPLKGLSATFAHQAGFNRQTRWLLKRRLIRLSGGRYVPTREGKRVYDYQVSL